MPSGARADSGQKDIGTPAPIRSNPEDFEPFEEHCKAVAARDDPDQSQSSVDHGVEHDERGVLHLQPRSRTSADERPGQAQQELDPTRPAAIGGAQRGDVDHLGDIAGYNGDGARLFIDPGVPNMVSEYGAISKPHDAFEPFFGELQTEQFPWRSGEAIWCAFDYGSIAGKQGLKGILNHQRLPKRSWHWYRKHLLNIDPPPGRNTASRITCS